jgi:hypothetical protein
MDKDAFTLISRPQDRMKLFTDFGKSHGELLCKGKDESFCKYKAALFNPKTDTLECVPASTIVLEDGEEFLGHLFIGGEKYYFESKAIVNQAACTFRYLKMFITYNAAKTTAPTCRQVLKHFITS